MDLNEKDSIRLFDIALQIWQRQEKQLSIRYYAFRMMVKISKKYPELHREVLAFSDSAYTDSLTPGIRSSVQRLTFA
jgi:hypothetical protein